MGSPSSAADHSRVLPSSRRRELHRTVSLTDRSAITTTAAATAALPAPPRLATAAGADHTYCDTGAAYDRHQGALRVSAEEEAAAVAAAVAAAAEIAVVEETAAGVAWRWWWL